MPLYINAKLNFCVAFCFCKLQLQKQSFTFDFMLEKACIILFSMLYYANRFFNPQKLILLPDKNSFVKF